MLIKRTLSVLICVLTLAATLFVVPASASGVETVSVNGKTVVDTMTFGGVKLKAYYKPYFWGYDSDMSSLGSKYGGYCCAGFVYQFYKRVYGIEVKNLYAERNAYGYGSGVNFKKSSLDGLYYNTPTSSKGYFYRVKEPKVGDIVASNNHWAIAKKISKSGTITLIEQNYWYSAYSSARINRKVSKNNGNYWFFRYSGAKSSGNSSDEKEENPKTEIWTVCSDDGVNVRSGAGTKYRVKMTLADGEIVHITRKKMVDGILWGKSEYGWCAIEYCDYIKGTCKIDSFTVSFNPSGGKGKMQKMLYKKASEEKLPKNKFKNGSEAFMGWEVSRESDNKWLYTNGEKNEWYSENLQPFGFSKLTLKNKAEVSVFKAENNENILLYAAWPEKKIYADAVGFEIDESAIYSSNGAKVNVKVFLGDKYLKQKSYKLSFSKNKNVGYGLVKITLKGSYRGSYEREFQIVPKAVSSLKASKIAKTTINLSWKKNSKAKGYMIYRLDPKSGKYKKIKTIIENKTTSFKDSGLKAKTEYKYRIKAYAKVENKYLYSGYKYITAKTK